MANATVPSAGPFEEINLNTGGGPTIPVNAIPQTITENDDDKKEKDTAPDPKETNAERDQSPPSPVPPVPTTNCAQGKENPATMNNKPPATFAPNQAPPPPIYTTIYPPGVHPPPSPGQVPMYMPHGPTMYVIDASALGGMHHAFMIRHGDQLSMSPPVLIVADPYAMEWARRRRAMAIFLLMLLFFPIFILFLLSLSMP